MYTWQTGHDISGKSTGAGSLSIWTHNLKKLDFITSYESENYQGPAVRAEAGVQLNEYYQFAKDNGVTVVGGECDVRSARNIALHHLPWLRTLASMPVFCPRANRIPRPPDSRCCRRIYRRWRALSRGRTFRHGCRFRLRVDRCPGIGARGCHQQRHRPGPLLGLPRWRW